MSGLFLAAGLLLWLGQWATHARYLQKWDSAQYALALLTFDVRVHQPHPPGYPAYVAAGYLGQMLMGGDPNLGYLLVNWLLLGAAAWATYLLGRAWGGPLAGAVAALLFLASPLTIYYGSVLLSYPAGACWFTWLGWAAWRVAKEEDPRWWWPFLLAAIGGAFRLPSLILALPLLAWIWWRLPLKGKVGGPLVLLGVMLLAYWPVFHASGGFPGWQEALRTEGVKHETRFSRFDTAPLKELRDNWLAMRDFFWQSYLLPIPVLLLLLLIPLAKRLPGYTLDTPKLPFAFLLWWVLPGVLFYLVVHVNLVGIFLDYSPSVALVIAFGVARFTGQRVVPAGLFLLLMVNLLLWQFSTAALRLNPKRVGVADVPGSPQLELTDRLMEVHIHDIPAVAPSANSILLMGETFKQDGYYLPNHRVIWDKYLLRASGPPEEPILTMQRHTLEPWVLPGRRLDDGKTMRYLAFPPDTWWLITTGDALGALDPEQQSLAEPVSERSEGAVVRLPVAEFSGLVAITAGGWQLVATPPDFAR